MDKNSPPEESSSKAVPGVSYAAVLLVLAILGTGLRFYRLGFHSIWADEGGSLYVAQLDLPAMVEHLCHYDSHPPLYFLILRSMLKLGWNEFILRLPSALCGSLTLLITYLLARKLFDRTTALIALFFMAVSAAQIYVVQEVRMYPLFIFLSLLSTYFFIELKNQRTVAMGILYVLSLTLMLYTHYLGILVLLSHILALILFFRERKLIKPFLYAYGMTLLLFVPCMNLLYLQIISNQGPSYGSFAPMALVMFFVSAFAGYTFPVVGYQGEFVLLVLLAIIFPLAGSIAVLTGERKASLLFIICYLLLPLFLVGAASIFHVKQAFLIRYFTFVMPAYFILMAHILSHLREGGRKIIFYLVIVAYLFVNTMALYNWYFIPGFQKQRWKEAIIYVNNARKPHDAIVVQDFLQIHPVNYYITDRHDIFRIRPADMPAPLEEMVKTHDRVWFLASLGWRERDPESKVLGWLSTNMENVESRNYQNIDSYANVIVLLFQKKGSEGIRLERPSKPGE
jgi:mannosyltransferase